MHGIAAGTQQLLRRCMRVPVIGIVLTGARDVPISFSIAAADLRYFNPRHMKRRFRAANLRFCKIEHPPSWKDKVLEAELGDICPLSSP